jgi:hypothetical protein
MRCLLCPTPDDQRPRGGGSDFESLFGDLVRQQENLWWSVTGGSYSPWSLPPDWYGDDDAEDAFNGQFEKTPDGEHAVATAAVFRDAMKYLNDFWLGVYAFREKPQAIDVDSWWVGDGLPLAAGVARGAAHAFVNVDGSYWAALSNEEALLRGFANKWPLAKFVAVAKADAR